MWQSQSEARDIRTDMRCERDSRTGAADDVGDTRDATVGLWDDNDTKSRSLRRAGNAGEREMNLVITFKDYDQLGGRP